RLMLPACVTTVVRLSMTQNKVCYAHAGDTSLITRYKDGTVQQLTRDEMGLYDAKALQVAKEIRTETRVPNLSDVVKDERVVAVNMHNGIYHNYVDESGNTDPEIGVGVVNGLLELEDYVDTGEFNTENIASLILCTDG